MTVKHQVTVESSNCYRVFGSPAARVSLSSDRIRIEGANGKSLFEISIASVAKIVVDQSWFWFRLKIESTDGCRYSVGGLDATGATRVRDAAQEMAEQLARAECANLLRLDEQRLELFDGRRYVQRRDAMEFHEAIVSTLRRSKGIVRRKLAETEPNVFSRIECLEGAEELECVRNRANDTFIRNSVPAVKLAAKSDFDIKLTDEQAVAIATDEEATLVLAGAGTGKTAVITGKVAHLVRNEGVAPEEILVLAFNRTAVQEIRGRLPDDLSGTRVYTFHGFGNSIIGSSGTKRTVSKFAEDERVTEKLVHNAIDEILGGTDPSDDVSEFVAYHRVPYQSPFEFDSRGEYFRYVNDWDKRTLSGAKVKSFEELAIANFLTLNGIKFEYEAPYRVDTATGNFRQYKPDFYLPDHDIYIEHFALDENGKAPSGWDRYVEGVEWKRGIHKRCGTTLVETHSWQRSQGILRHELKKRLSEHGVPFKKVSFRDALRQLTKWVISWLARLLTKFLNHVKTSGLSRDQLRQRASASANPIRSRSFLKVFEKVWDRYEATLKAEGTIDFHDMINNAAGLIRAGRVRSRFRYVLVDEFQDISAGRMRLLDALDHQNISYFVVGDDWQSIYRFAGSDVSLVKDCGEYLGYVQQRELTQTFRFGDGILEPSTAFVQRNPEQTQRTLRSAISNKDCGITIVSDTEVERAIDESLHDIERRLGSQNVGNLSVLVLGRYRNSKQHLTGVERRFSRFTICFSTVHRAKGQEADYVVVLDLKNAQNGFPAKIDDDPLLEMVMPSKSANGLPHAEERRLFYVAMTRAQRGSYLITDERQPSEFVTEIRKNHPGVRQIGKLASEQFPNCPNCSSGQLVVSKSEKNLRCTNHPMCDHLAPRCEKCLAGYLAGANQSGFLACTNSNCDRLEVLCPKCKVGFLKKRKGPYSVFWGCTEYSSDPPCRYKRPDHPV